MVHCLLLSEQKTLTVHKAMQGRYESKLESGKNGFEAILSCVEFQPGPYKTGLPKYLENITAHLWPKLWTHLAIL